MYHSNELPQTKEITKISLADYWISFNNESCPPIESADSNRIFVFPTRNGPVPRASIDTTSSAPQTKLSGKKQREFRRFILERDLLASERGACTPQ